MNWKLSSIQIADEGMKELSGPTNRTALNLEGTKIPDASRKELCELTSLTSLKVTYTETTTTGVNEPTQYLPNSKTYTGQ